MSDIKKPILLFLLLLLTVRVFADYTYTLDRGNATITKYVGDFIDLIIPRTISGHLVTAIGKKAFGNNQNLTTISIPSSVISIGDWAFESCNRLTNIIIPDSVKSIGALAFVGCKKLTITVEKGSFAEEYAINNNIPYKYQEAKIWLIY